MKREFTIPVTVTAHTMEEAQAQLDLLFQIGAFLKDFNVQNLAGSFISHFMLAKLSQYTQGKVDLSGCYSPSCQVPVSVSESPFVKKQRKDSMPK